MKYLLTAIVVSCICVGIPSVNYYERQSNLKILREEAYNLLRATTYDGTWRVVKDELNNDIYVAYMQSTYEKQSNKNQKIELKIIGKMNDKKLNLRLINIMPYDPSIEDGN